MEVVIKEDLLYTETHEWVKVDGDLAYIGITDYASKELGDIVYVELPEDEDIVEVGEPFGNVEAVKAVEDINSPVSGEVVKFNEDLEDQPELINNSPYEDGWLIQVRLSDKSELDALLNTDDYKKIVE
ncbi:MAG: glycine cleavage system protein GcvH [Candidatus Cloacimonadota bacterium]|nr:glycine cleavage system protein GcvH [Candidatus Cloacimonadota bacterium]